MKEEDEVAAAEEEEEDGDDEEEGGLRVSLPGVVSVVGFSTFAPLPPPPSFPPPCALVLPFPPPLIELGTSPSFILFLWPPDFSEQNVRLPCHFLSPRPRSIPRFWVLRRRVVGLLPHGVKEEPVVGSRLGKGEKVRAPCCPSFRR